MNKATYYAGIGIASAAFLFLIFTEMKWHAEPGVVGGLIAAVIVGGCILMAFSDKIEKTDKMSKTY
ncbi:MAG: hypothetical protein KGI27_03080 [Thaumarchaeota archaeon]|nr:hypothetical protein [Nitrososphaerota archaeon]